MEINKIEIKIKSIEDLKKLPSVLKEQGVPKEKIETVERIVNEKINEMRSRLSLDDKDRAFIDEVVSAFERYHGGSYPKEIADNKSTDDLVCIIAYNIIERKEIDGYLSLDEKAAKHLSFDVFEAVITRLAKKGEDGNEAQ